MENKKLSIALAVVIVLILGIGIFTFIHFSKENKEDEGSYNPNYVDLPPAKDTEVGEYRFVNISEQDLVIAYYKDFINEARKNPKNAWKKLNISNQSSKFNSNYEEFEKYVNKYYSSNKSDIYTAKK